MKQLFDFFPLLLFFISYKFYDIYKATMVLIISTGLVIIFYLVRYRKIEKMLLFSFVILIIFGTLTLAFHDDTFIKWKVTVMYAFFSIVLIFSRYVLKKPLLPQLLGQELNLPNIIWEYLNIAWAAFFFFCSIANIYVAFNYSQAGWVQFKVFILPGLTFIFLLINGLYIYRYLINRKKK